MEDKRKGILPVRDNEIRKQGVGMPTVTSDSGYDHRPAAGPSIHDVYDAASINGKETAFPSCTAVRASLPERDSRIPEPFQFCIGNKKRQI